ncbi:hypothetical protein DXG01_002523 [Tephrocybe rancida]|nr:hypothetical protein DXG01_002523 [Tephrocybe rancida]
MTVSVGGLGLVSLRNPFSELVGMVLGKTDLRSMFCLVVFFIVIFVLAYLTNPSENSFRAYLTEQSFRQHLSRLDDNNDDDHKRPATSTRKTSSTTAHTFSNDASSTFHFANKASISLKTPKHVFHSFGLFTIAAMVPLARSSRPYERENLIISDSWYIGAFGRWWRGGIIEAWYQDVIARSKDEESWSSGISKMKSLDMLGDYNGLPFSTKNIVPQMLSRGSPPKLRSRDKPSQRPAVLPARSSTPPPLPKSASLPLHTARLPSSATDRLPTLPQPITPIHTCTPTDQARLNSPLISRSPSTLFDQSPCITEVLRQISHSKAAVLELRAQLSDCQSCASQSHGALQGELDSFRERKRQEDASKLETKTRTKSLDDSRRGTESMKKDAEKKLKIAQTARDNATQRMEHLDKEIAKLQNRLAEDEATVHDATIPEAEKEIAEILERKRHEIKVAEDVVAALNQRARELEDKLAESRQTLAMMKERMQTRAFETAQAVTHQDPVWNNAGSIAHESVNAPSTPEHHSPVVAFQAANGHSRRPSLTIDTPAQAVNLSQKISSPTNAYSAFDDAYLHAVHQQVSYGHHSTTFSPFGDLDGTQASDLSGVVSPTSQSLIPSALITSLENGGLPRSFQSESDVFMDRSDWRNHAYKQHVHSRSNDSHESGSGSFTLPSSPVSAHGSHNSIEHDPFEVRFMANESDFGQDYRRDQHSFRNLSENSMDLQRASWSHRASSDPHPHHHAQDEADRETSVVEKSGPRRWFTSKEKAKKGLNPDAKVFSLARKPSPPRSFAPGSVFRVSPPSHLFDALNPNGLSSATIPAPVTNSFTRAFAPSPAEREALQRALGGSTNTSFERLPSLSDVGSIPSSPSHVHALPAAIPHQVFAKILPEWLQSLPPRKTTNFSPWDDEEPEVSSGSSVGKHR